MIIALGISIFIIIVLIFVISKMTNALVRKNRLIESYQLTIKDLHENSKVLQKDTNKTKK